MQEFSDQMPSDIKRYPMVPIRDVVIFPFTKVAFKIGRPSSVRALEQAMTGDRDIFLATQHDATVDEPSANEIYTGRNPRSNSPGPATGQWTDKSCCRRPRKGTVSTSRTDRGRNVFCPCAQVRFDGRVGLSDRRTAAKDPYAWSNSFCAFRLTLTQTHYTLRLRGISAAQIADSMSSHLRITVEEKQDLLETFSVQERLQKLITFSRQK